MMEYFTIDCTHHKLEETLNIYARTGWELHTAVYNEGWSLIFKRLYRA